MIRLRSILLFTLLFNLIPLSKAYGTASAAFTSLDSATTKIDSGQRFVGTFPFDFAAADNNFRKAKLDIAKAQSSAIKGSDKLTGKNLTNFQKLVTKLNSEIDQARTYIKQKKARPASVTADKIIKNLETAMKIFRGYAGGDSECIFSFTVESLGVPDVYKTHITAICPFVYDDVSAIFASEEIGSLSYGYSNFGGADEDAFSCTKNGNFYGECAGIQGRPGGTYAMRLNVYLPEATPTVVRIVIKRYGTTVVDTQVVAH